MLIGTFSVQGPSEVGDRYSADLGSGNEFCEGLPSG